MKRAVCVFAFLLAGCATFGSDTAREKRLADEVVPGLVVGDAVQIEAGAQRFLGLLTPGAGKRKGAVMLVHGTGVHPDSGVVGQLRASLADLGYTTLSVQMPVLAATEPAERYVELFPQAAERLSAAVRYLNARGFPRVAVVSHSMGARMANYWLSRKPTEPVAAWVPLAVSSGELESLTGLPFPVFDVYAEKDFDVVLENANERAAVLRHIRGSKQVMVYGTDHFFSRKEKELAVLLDQLLAPVLR
jgi:pimeloyl-ACP methyl ester carboxylesterase